MIETLEKLRDNHGCIGIKAEFEAEGTRHEEAVLLSRICTEVGLPLTIKIGGCEAVRDMYEAKSLGAARIVAPMCESFYAVQKFGYQAKRVLDGATLAINVETDTTVKYLQYVLNECVRQGITDIVVGRVDLSSSMGYTRADINGPRVEDTVRFILHACKKRGLTTGVGGGVSAESLPIFQRYGDLIDIFETRKVMFKADGQGGDAIDLALDFELKWLENKRDIYTAISQEDTNRINMLRARREGC